MNEYLVWKQTNPYYGKTFSFLTDCVTSCMNDSQNPLDFTETWPARLLDYVGSYLLAVSDVPESRTASSQKDKPEYPSSCHLSRIAMLEQGGLKPDVIVMAVGAADENSYQPAQDVYDLRAFKNAARLAAARIQEMAPEAQLIFVGPVSSFGSSSRAAIQQDLQDLAREMEVDYVDLSKIDDSQLNPQKLQEAMAEAVIRTLCDEKGASFLNEGEAPIQPPLPQKPEKHLDPVKPEPVPEPEPEPEPEEEISDSSFYDDDEDDDESAIFGWLAPKSKMTRKPDPAPAKVMPEPEPEPESEPDPAPRTQPELMEKHENFTLSTPEKASVLQEPVRLSALDLPPMPEAEEEDYSAVELRYTFEPAWQENPGSVPQSSDIQPEHYETVLKLKDLETGDSITMEKDVVSLGRKMLDNDITIRDGKISRNHAIFTYEAGKWAVCDLGSVNGTYLNGQRLLPNVSYPLKTDDQIRFSNKTMTFLSRLV